MGAGGEDCPFAFNFDPASFKVGDTVSYRVSTMEDWPFVGTLLEVHPDHVVISPGPDEPGARYKGTRESRPMVDGGAI
jgi:anthranilate/para-aminobenzoate synthase component II